ncbi:hypothetical protein BDZ94DRAFT_1256091 [Collybia nuda]|uniref:Uncharacterized protein n=1 Tax=Collybia nuda TaxID=64659 RepID=A0A9P6CFW5_9AGAR|nr:hypothetical protein BDZ94DRAFT_1256091 [Collybia nuda]
MGDLVDLRLLLNFLVIFREGVHAAKRSSWMNRPRHHTMKLDSKIYRLASVLSLGAVIGTWLLVRVQESPSLISSSGPLSFVVPFNNEKVAMRVINGVRYGVGNDASAEWDVILPAGGHCVHVGDERYTVTLFHQLKCLQIIREQYMAPATDPILPHTQHCMNYLRQTLLCRPNLRLESVEDDFGLAERNYDTICKDWTKVYEEADRNQRAYAVMMQSDGDPRMSV